MFSLTMHAIALAGLTQYTTHHHIELNLDKQRLPQPIYGMQLTEHRVPPGRTVTNALHERGEPPSADRPLQQIAAETSPQPTLPTFKLAGPYAAHSVDDATYDVHAGGDTSHSPTTTAKLIAGAVEQSRGDGHGTAASTTPLEGQPDHRPTQGARPDYAYNPQPDYPMLLREQGVGGVVWLRVWVSSDGRPVEIKLAKGSGYRLLDDAALRAVKLWRFIPAKNGEQSLASWVEFPIRFTLNG
ncbi:MAG: energy transducer TonB [Rhodoferax sp.]|nr:energy transducer TonB [Rhodoferax sp.]